MARVVQCAVMLQSSEGGGTSLVAFPTSFGEEDIELLVTYTLAAKLLGLCVDDSKVLFEGVEDLTVADMLLTEDALVLLFALLVVVLGELTGEGHGLCWCWGCGGCGGVWGERKEMDGAEVVVCGGMYMAKGPLAIRKGNTCTIQTRLNMPPQTHYNYK